jgi:hypothetical protein
MFKKTMLVILSGMLMLNLTGCFLFVAGVAGGAGTSVWLSGKLTQEFHATFQSTIDATKSALQSLNYPLVKETYDENIAQIKSTYSDGREIWIDIHHVTDYSTKVDVRVGGVNPDKEAAGLVLKKIQDFL